MLSLASYRFELSPYILLLKLYLDDSPRKSFHIRILDALLHCLVFCLNHTTHSVESLSSNSLSHPSPAPHHGDRSPSSIARQNILCRDREKCHPQETRRNRLCGRSPRTTQRLYRDSHATDSTVKMLDSKRNMEQQEHEKYRDSTMRRLANNISGNKEAFEEKAKREEGTRVL